MQEFEYTVKEKTRNFIVSNFFLDTASVMIDDSTSFLDSGIIDSTGILEVINYLQDEFRITIEDHEMIPDNLDSLSNIGTFVSKKMAMSMSVPGAVMVD